MFIGQVANEFGLEIRWDKMERGEFIDACVEGFQSGTSDALGKLFNRHTKAIGRENK